MKIKSVVIMLTFVSLTSLKAQNFIDCPPGMPQDTMFVRTRITRDFYFNATNDSTSRTRQMGPVDYNIVASVGAETDTLVAEMYGITRKLNYGSTVYSTYYTDSTRVSSSIPLTTTPALVTVPLDQLFAAFPEFDGVRIVLKKNGADSDEDTMNHGLRIWPQGGN